MEYVGGSHRIETSDVGGDKLSRILRAKYIWTFSDRCWEIILQFY